MTELVFHVGAGKTGSSSIQATLSNNSEALEKEGICYWALMLERAPYQRFEWQGTGRTELYYKTEGSSEQLFEVITHSLDIAEREGARTAIWSNEWFMGADYEFRRNLDTIKIVKKLISSGIKVRVVAYIREHVSWAISAYSQWGLKDKTYTGPVMAFRDYTRSRPPKFARALNAWHEGTQNSLQIYNFAQTGDVCKHFLETVCGVTGDNYDIHRVNERLDVVEQFLRTAFHEIFSGGSTCSPAVFDKYCIRRLSDATQVDLIEWCNSLLPSKDDISQLYTVLQEDIHSVNQLLAGCGEAPLTMFSSDTKNTLGVQEIRQIAYSMTAFGIKCLREIEDLTAENRKLARQISELESIAKPGKQDL